MFAAQETISDGLGPVYHAQSCGECHQNPITGGNSQVLVQRAGNLVNGLFVDHPGGALIHSRAIDARVQERILPNNPVRTFRTSLGLHGDGFVEAIADSTLLAIANAQRARSLGLIHGEAIMVPVFEAPGQFRVGRFGHKAQQASLVSFSADAYLNEMGITTPFLPTENTSNSTSVADFDTAADPEDDGQDVQVFARFVRSLTAPARDEVLAATADAQAGEALFTAIGCRTRNQFMHDGGMLTLEEAISRHGGEAALQRLGFAALSNAKRQRLVKFLLSL